MSFNALIPARAGSKRLVGKNLLDIDGDPLVVRAIKACLAVKGLRRLFVSTDSPEIGSLAEAYGAEWLKRPPHLADDGATVDAVVADFFTQRRVTEPGLLVVQPTVVASAGDTAAALNKLTTTYWASPVAIGVKPHSLIWPRVGGGIPSRGVNFSEITDYPLQEIGLRYYPELKGDGSIKQIVEVKGTFIDIDTSADLAAARQLAKPRKKIVFRVSHAPFVGSGHLNRALTIAKELQNHKISFFFNDKEHAPEDFPFKTRDMLMQPWPDLIINDALDTEESTMLAWRAKAPVITFEDLGSGAKYANAVVNALYQEKGVPNAYSGADYAILRPEFRNTGFSRRGVLVSFGGADALNLTDRLYAMYGEQKDFIFVKPPYGISQVGIKNPSMGRLMNGVALVITSAGRTLLEAAACGTPAVVIAQNVRESHHAHLGSEKGNIYLGMGHLVTNEEIDRAVTSVLNDFGLQDELSARALQSIDRRGLQRVLAIIEDVLHG